MVSEIVEETEYVNEPCRFENTSEILVRISEENAVNAAFS